jgi:diaminohydroxyphosphoribosylaminopyrimidine deaminase/5-amino-6-(5-phosphoribosylamino)uracil reductase
MDEKIKPGQVITPAQAMRLAISEGYKGAGHVSPNPLVGCTIVDRNHRFLAVGYHAKVGHDHAEIDAMKKVGDDAKLVGAHFYVTLEPCAHQGRTPSCARTLAPLGVSSVSYAVQDPNPAVSGQGAAILREAGVRAELFSSCADVPESERVELTEAAEDLAEIFLHNMRTNEPFVAVKIATTLDGKMALASGESKWITGESARAHVHLMRARYDAMGIGRNTFVTDNPFLNVRHPDYPNFENHVVIFDPRGFTLAALANSNIMKVRRRDSVLVIVDDKLEFTNPAGVRLVPTPSENGSFSVESILASLKKQGITSLMLEGGAATVGAFFRAGKVQRLHLYQAPTIIGGKHGVAWSSGFGFEKMSQGYRLERCERREFGPDLYWTGRIR